MQLNQGINKSKIYSSKRCLNELREISVKPHILNIKNSLKIQRLMVIIYGANKPKSHHIISNEMQSLGVSYMGY